ncbi:MAG TPA: hypothetical protein VFH27_11875 [Longimicrobiaceae bacterium]|nr:hypothetical protein [Longimicrobiaceae bacterium]
MRIREFFVYSGRRSALAALVVGLGVAAAPARAQDLTVYGTASADGYSTDLGLVGATIRPAGQGWVPIGSLQVYGVRYESATDVHNTVWAVVPGIGVGYRGATGGVEAKVGYSFQSDEGVPFIDGVGGRSGVVTSAQGNYWGGPVELQGITSYAWKPEYSWNQAQASVPVWHGASSNSANLGAQVVYEGKLGGSGSYHTWSAGPLLKYNTGHQSSVSLSAGVKKRSFEDNNTWYASVGLVRYGISLGGSK